MAQAGVWQGVEAGDGCLMVCCVTTAIALPCMRAFPAATLRWSVRAHLLWKLTDSPPCTRVLPGLPLTLPPVQQLEVGLPDVMMQGVEQYTQVGWECLSCSVTRGIKSCSRPNTCGLCSVRFQVDVRRLLPFACAVGRRWTLQATPLPLATKPVVLPTALPSLCSISMRSTPRRGAWHGRCAVHAVHVCEALRPDHNHVQCGMARLPGAPEPPMHARASRCLLSRTHCPAPHR